MLALGTTAMAQQNGDIAEEFDQLIENANDWKNYRLIKERDVRDLKKQTVDQIDALEARITELEGTLAERDGQVVGLEENVRDSASKIDALTTEKEEIQVLGMSMDKTSYNLIVWSMIGILLLLFLVVLFRYRSSYAVIKEQKTALSETERELEETRQKAIEKEQKMGRMLQDERNKNRGGGVK